VADRAPGPDEEAEAACATRMALEQVLARLDPRERVVLELRHGVADERVHTLAEVGERVGLTRERVRQIEARALTKLRRDRRLLADLADLLG